MERGCFSTVFATLVEAIVIEDRVMVFAFAHIDLLLLCIYKFLLIHSKLCTILSCVSCCAK
jgi:hypothetical protein